MKRLQIPLVLFLTVIMAFAIAMLVFVPALDPPPAAQDIQLMFLFMSASGGATLGLAYFLNRGGVIQWFNSLRWTLLATILLTVALVFVNVWLTAKLMFISDHDLILTTALLIFAGLISAASVFFISGALIDRIRALVQAAERLGKGDLTTRLPLQGKDELAQFAETFNMMADALQVVDEQKRQLEQARRDLIAWVSHDLRTPLAAIRAMNDAMLDGVVTDEETITRYQINTQKEIQHLARLIDDLFALAQLDTGRINLQRETTSLRDLISDALGSVAVRAERQQIYLTGEVMDGLDMIDIAPDKIQRVLFNLLDNALHHTASGGAITLKAKQVNDEAHVCIHNTGTPIDESDLPHIFKSFYRGETSRAQKDGHRGTGLGLAIARGFVEAHGGQIWVEPSHNGTSFVFSLPLINNGNRFMHSTDAL